jgi:hypothetical protein
MDEIRLNDYCDAMNIKNELFAFQCSLSPSPYDELRHIKTQKEITVS